MFFENGSQYERVPRMEQKIIKVEVMGLSRPKVVILGAGYGGIMTTVRLQKLISSNEAEVILVNKHNYHYQSTWLHEPAAGTLHHDQTRILIDDVIDKNKVKFLQDTVNTIKKDEKKVVLENNGEIDYDILVIGLGFESATFGIPGLKEHAFGIVNVDAVREIRQHIELMFAQYNNLPEPKEDVLTFVVGGAGFSGVEFLGEFVNRVPELCKEYDIPREKVRIISVEGAPTVMPGFDPELVQYATNFFERHGVELKTGTFMKECSPEGVKIAKGEEIEEIKARTVIWTGGVQGNSIVGESGFEVNRGRCPVRKELRAPGYDDVFVVGDCALIMNEENGRPYPPTAQAAIQEAYVCARNVKKLIQGKTDLEEFKYEPKGTVASLGDKDGIGIIGEKKVFGGQAAFWKKVIDNRYLFLLGGMKLVLKKGKLNMF